MFVHHIVSTYGVCYDWPDCKFDYAFGNIIFSLVSFAQPDYMNANGARRSTIRRWPFLLIVRHVMLIFFMN